MITRTITNAGDPWYLADGITPQEGTRVRFTLTDLSGAAIMRTSESSGESCSWYHETATVLGIFAITVPDNDDLAESQYLITVTPNDGSGAIAQRWRAHVPQGADDLAWNDLIAAGDRLA